MFGKSLTARTDEELMLMIREGHERAFTTLYNRYSTALLRYFFRMLWRDKKRAEDLLQDLFVKIIERPQFFDPEKKFSTWIFSVAHNMCKNEYRKEEYRRAFADDQQQSLATQEQIGTQIDAAAFRDKVEASIKNWKEDDRSLFMLRHELEMTFAEIGMILNCPEGTAKSRWFYLKKELAGQLSAFESILKH